MFSGNQSVNIDMDKLINECQYEVKQEFRSAVNRPEIREIAAMVAASAARIGVTNEKDIYDVLVVLITQQFPKFFTTETKFADTESIPLYNQRIISLHWSLKNCDIDYLLHHFFHERNDRLWRGMASQLSALSVWRGNVRDLPDWVGIYRVLADNSKVFEYLDLFEQGLQDYVAKFPVDWQFPKRADGKFELPKPEEKEFACYKLLSNFFSEWAQENGFKQEAKFIQALSANDFNNTLTSLSFFKDRATDIGANHGIWTHALQLFVILEHYKKTWFLKHHPLEIYQRIGDQSLYGKNINGQRPWDILFDNTSQGNSTVPETLSLYIRLNANTWPLLGESVKRQRQKMLKAKDDDERLKFKYLNEEKNGVVTRPFRSKL